MKITWNEISLNKLGRMKKCSEHYEILQIVFPEKDVVNLSIADYRKLTDLTIDLLNPPTPKLPNFKEFDYDLVLNLNDFNVGQYFDYIGAKSDDYISILSTIMIPKGKSYGEYDIDKVKGDIGNKISVQQAVDLVHFFQVASETYTKNLQIYSMKYLRLKLKTESLKWKFLKMIGLINYTK